MGPDYLIINDQDDDYKAIPINDNIENLIVDATKYATEHERQAPGVIRIVKDLIPAMTVNGLEKLQQAILPCRDKPDWRKLLDRVETQLQRIYDDDEED